MTAEESSNKSMQAASPSFRVRINASLAQGVVLMSRRKDQHNLFNDAVA